MRNWSTVPTIQNLAWSLLLTSLLEHLVYLKKRPNQTPHPVECKDTKDSCSWTCWGVTPDFCHCRTTSLLQTPTTCWPARGAAPTCWTKWSTPSSAGSCRSRSSANLSLTVTLCWANRGSGKELQGCGLVERADRSLPDPANSEEFSWMICYWLKKKKLKKYLNFEGMYWSGSSLKRLVNQKLKSLFSNGFY